MKTFKIIANIIIGLTLLGATACSEEIMNEIDTNPNNPVDVPLSLLMPQATIDIPVGVSALDLAWYTSVFVEHTTGAHAQLRGADRRTAEINPTMGNNRWNDLYAGVIPVLNTIIERAGPDGAEPGRNIHVGIAQVLKAYTVAVLTDMWGDIPYTEAWQGSDNRAPAYDSQEFIYTQVLQQLLDQAIANLSTESIYNPGITDLIFGGNADRWIKTAWGLKARYYQRLSNTTHYNPQQVIEATNNSFTSRDEEFKFTNFAESPTSQHPWYQESNLRKHHVFSQQVYNQLNQRNDPRLSVWIAPVLGSDNVFNPAPSGAAENDQTGNIYSKPSANVIYPSAPLELMTYDEVLFIRAEALLASNDPDGAKDAYTDAITSSLQRWGVSAANIETFLNQDQVVPGGNITQENIIIQKYLAFWLYNPIEAFNDYRRTGFPQMTNAIGPPPHRFPYPQSEYDSNAENVPLMPETIYTVKLWWAR
jgi:hypothetical protein